MLVHTKKRHIDDVTLSFIGPSEMKAKAVEFMQSIGFVILKVPFPGGRHSPNLPEMKKGSLWLKLGAKKA